MITITGEKVPQQKETRFLSLIKTAFLRFMFSKTLTKFEDKSTLFISNFLRKTRVLISCNKKDAIPITKTTPIAKISAFGSERGTSNITVEIYF